MKLGVCHADQMLIKAQHTMQIKDLTNTEYIPDVHNGTTYYDV